MPEYQSVPAIVVEVSSLLVTVTQIGCVELILPRDPHSTGWTNAARALAKYLKLERAHELPQGGWVGALLDTDGEPGGVISYAFIVPSRS